MKVYSFFMVLFSAWEIFVFIFLGLQSIAMALRHRYLPKESFPPLRLDEDEMEDEDELDELAEREAFFEPEEMERGKYYISMMAFLIGSFVYLLFFKRGSLCNFFCFLILGCRSK